jgi:UDP-N-acetylglucosamine--N-acetylmuramyl-(pentapeptide) pyrophosphoryl-undecaprenol N-acetylglucosamine transferase
MKGKKVIISGGGTAGHLYPALAVSLKLKEKDPDVVITFVGSTRLLEKKIMNHYQADFIPLKIEGLKGRGIKTLKSLLILPYSFFKSLVILIRIKPQLVIGVGGYSSGPIVLLASWLKIPTLILEQNRVPGFTNRLLLPWVKKAVAAFESSLPHFKGKGIFIGNPTREEFNTIPPKKRNSKLSLLIFGGSQGSHFLNKNVSASLPYLKEKKENLKIYHQTGKNDWDWIKTEYFENGFKEATVSPFFFDMHEYFKKTDLIICRAGATTIAELIAAGKASILVPFAKASDNHQVLNARELEKIGGAEIILEEEFTPEKFKGKIFDFINDKKKIDEMEKNISRLKTENTTEKIANICFQLMGAEN